MTKKRTYTVLIVLLCILAALLAGILAFHLIRGGRTIIHSLEEMELYELCYDESFDSPFTDITLKTNAGEMEIIPSPDNKVHLRIWADEKKVKVTQFDTSLNVTANAEGRIKVGVNTFNKRLTKIELALPTDYSGTLNVKSNYGNMDMAAFPQLTVKAESNYGNLDINSAAALEAECEFGNITVGEISGKLLLKTDYGNVEIDKLTLREDSFISCEVGNIHIGNAEKILIQAETEIGSQDIRPNPSDCTAVLTIESETGSVTVK